MFLDARPRVATRHSRAYSHRATTPYYLPLASAILSTHETPHRGSMHDLCALAATNHRQRYLSTIRHTETDAGASLRGKAVRK